MSNHAVLHLILAAFAACLAVSLLLQQHLRGELLSHGKRLINNNLFHSFFRLRPMSSTCNFWQLVKEYSDPGWPEPRNLATYRLHDARVLCARYSKMHQGGLFAVCW